MTGVERKRGLFRCQAGNMDTVCGGNRTLEQAISLYKLDQRHCNIIIRDSD